MPLTLEEKLAAYPNLLEPYNGNAAAYEADCNQSAQEARRIYAEVQKRKGTPCDTFSQQS